MKQNKDYKFVLIKFSFANEDYDRALNKELAVHLNEGWEITSVSSISRSTLGNMFMSAGFTNGLFVVLSREKASTNI